MNVTDEQIQESIAPQMAVASKLVKRALEANATHARPSSVTVVFTAKRDKKNPNVIALHAVAKTKEPKSSRTDLTGKTDSEEIMRLTADEDEGQQRIDG